MASTCDDQIVFIVSLNLTLALVQMLDLNPHSVSSGGWLEDVSLVKKYEISEDAYNKREGETRTILRVRPSRLLRLPDCDDGEERQSDCGDDSSNIDHETPMRREFYSMADTSR